MARSNSSQHKLDNIRKPRVHITTDIEVNGESPQRELPFVMGILADLSGHPKEPLPRLKDRSFVNIDAETFDDVMKGIAPRLKINVENTLSPEAGDLSVELNFNRMADFEPEQIVLKVEKLRELLAKRQKLTDLESSYEAVPKFADALGDVVGDTDKLKRLRGEVRGTESDTSPEPESA